MKKTTLIIIFMISTILLHAQKVKVDDGTVSIDKVPVAKLEGKASLLKGIDLTYKSLDGQPLLRLTMKSSNYFIPTQTNIYWYDIEFFKTAKRVNILIKSGTYYSEKKLSELLFVTNVPSLLKNNEIDTASLRIFTAKNDASEKIKNDTSVYAEYESMLINKLKNSKIDRDLKKLVTCLQTSSNTLAWITTTTYDIIQDKILIGSIEKVIENANTGLSGKYKIFKKYNIPEIIGDKTFTNGIAAYIELGNYPKIITIQDKKNTRMESGIGDNSQQQIAEFLVNKGYL